MKHVSTAPFLPRGELLRWRQVIDTERHPTTHVADIGFVEHGVPRGPSFLLSLG